MQIKYHTQEIPGFFLAGKGVRYKTFAEYRTLHSYKLFWAVCHLFPQRWRTLNIQSRETIGQEDHVTCLKLGPRVNSSPAFLSHLQDDVFIENTRHVLNMSRGPPGQWFPETEYWASAIFVGTSGIPTKIIYRSVKSYNR